MTFETVKNWFDDLKLPPLKSGSHNSAEAGMCAMELVAFIEQLPHSDMPPCTSRVIAMYVQKLNDWLRDDERHVLMPYLSKVVGTNDAALESRRIDIVRWSAIKVFAPTALRYANLDNLAVQLESIDESLGFDAATVICNQVKTAAYAADAAAYAADAAAYAADAADAADAAAYAADAADAAAYAAYAAYAADAADANARKEIIFARLKVLDDLLAVGQSGSFTKPIPAKELALLA